MTKVSLEVNGKKVVKEIPDHTTLSRLSKKLKPMLKLKMA